MRGVGGQTRLEAYLGAGMYRATNSDSRVNKIEGEESEQFLSDAKKRLDLLKSITGNAETIETFEESLGAIIAERSHNLETEENAEQFFNEAEQVGISKDMQAKGVAYFVVDSSLHPENPSLNGRLTRIDSMAQKVGMTKEVFLEKTKNFLMNILTHRDFEEAKRSLGIRTENFESVNLFINCMKSIGMDTEKVAIEVDKLVLRSFDHYRPKGLWHPHDLQQLAIRGREGFEKLPRDLQDKYKDLYNEKIESRLPVVMET